MKAKLWLGGAAAVACIGAAEPPPVATYWMDAATQSGFGAGMAGGQQPDMAQVMQMLQGGGAPQRTLELRLGSKQKPPAAPSADHLPPAALAMGPALPLVAPPRPPEVKSDLPFERPKGRMLIYWGCGEQVSAGQPTVIDFATLAAGKLPPGMAAMARTGVAATGPRPGATASYGEWPNPRDSRPVPANASLVGGHKVQANYAPPIAFTLAAGQDFMPGLGFAEAGTLPSGAARLTWRRAPQATGYALAMFGANQSGDVIMWTSAKSASMSPNMDYLPPAEVKRLIASGAVLPPTADQCLLPAAVARAVPQGAVTMIGYGPEVHFTEAPKAPKWTAKVRYKSTATLMRGMGDMMGGMSGMDAMDAQAPQSGQQPQPQPPARKKKRGFGLGDLIEGATGVPIPR